MIRYRKLFEYLDYGLSIQNIKLFYYLSSKNIKARRFLFSSSIEDFKLSLNTIKH